MVGGLLDLRCAQAAMSLYVPSSICGDNVFYCLQKLHQAAFCDSGHAFRKMYSRHWTTGEFAESSVV